MDYPILFIIDVAAGLYAAFLTYAYFRNKFLSISSRLRESAISVTMLFIGVWYLVEAFPIVLAWTSVMSWLVYHDALKVEQRGRERMNSKES